MKITTAIPALAAAAVTVEAGHKPQKPTTGPTVYMIRHAEKPPTGNKLSAAGLKRAQCLRSVFGAASDYNIGHIMAMTPKKSTGTRRRPLDTVRPLANDLDLAVDTSCGRDDMKCVAKAVHAYRGDGNILICWEHTRLATIAHALGADDPPDYPDDSYNLIWTDPYGYAAVTNITSQSCRGLDE